ncbi:hypothetical protein NP493_2144g00001 [Ridgeia piscesae]|uniref:Uncharacterized protein n=1 Tax=Ridgeia piscesae TaxID=27915 RepID=A0AAD9JKJ5_RIDPI|nr:hypothetical protein NP493_2144g00001 [Ridgeia piscesae]
MLRSKVAFRIRQKHNRQGTSKPTKLNPAKLSTISHRESFGQEMDSALAQWEEKENSTPDDKWAALQQVVYHTAKTYIGKPHRKHQDWFDPNAQELQTLMSRRDQAHQRVLQTRSTRSTTAAYKDACRLLQKRTRRNLSSFHSRQDLRQDPPQQTIYPHNTRGSSGDTMWLQRKPEHRRYDILSPTTTRKVH